MNSRPILTALLLGTALLSARENPARSHRKSFQMEGTGQFNGNRIASDLENNGMIVSHRITGHSGLEWPQDNHTYAVFASGLWLAGKVNGDIRTACAEYGPERSPGPWGSDSLDPGRKLFSVYKSDLANPGNNDDFQNWPVDLGAPWVDIDEDGLYNPLPNGPDHPEFIGDQVIWYVSNDGDVASHGIFGTEPLGVEVQTTIFGLKRTNALGDIMFVKELIINKGGHTIDDMYVGVWSDPDLGNAGDDFVGCDTTLGMGICYNDGMDGDYENFPGGTPAIGYDFFQGPMIPSIGDTAYSFGRYHVNKRNLRMTAFRNVNKAMWSIFHDPDDQFEAYFALAGLDNRGQPIINPATSQVTTFMVPGDPNLDSGPNDDIWIDRDTEYSGDKRFLISSGPFTMAPGDSQEVVYGIFLAADGDPLDSYTKVKEVDQIAQLLYDAHFIISPDPPIPEVRATTYADEVILTWDDAADDYYTTDNINLLPVPVSYDTVWTTVILDSIIVTLDTVVTEPGDTLIVTTIDTTFYYQQEIETIDTTFQGEPTHFSFEGYNVYQIDHPLSPTKKRKIATYDRINGVTDIFDDIFDRNWGTYINIRVQHGSDSGIRHYTRITEDWLNNNSPLKINREYYFAVSAYGYNPYGIPKTLESKPSVVTVRIERSGTWDYTDTLGTYGSVVYADHIAGTSEGQVKITVIDPKQVTGESYTVTLDDYTVIDGDTSLTINWSLANTTTGETLIANSTIFSGQNILTGEDMGLSSIPVVDGFQLEVQSPTADLHSISVVANADGPINPPVDGLAYWFFPSYLIADGGYSNQQVTTNTIWFFDIGPQYGFNETAMMDSMFAYTGGIGHALTGIGVLLPDDFEIRFTGNGEAIDYWGTGAVVAVPFEWWNVGTSDDPSDDFRMIVYLRDEDNNQEWNLQFGREEADHATSGGLNDPWTDRIYVLSPVDETPGSTGHDAFMAAYESGGSLPPWTAGPGDNDPGGPLDAWNAFSHVVFMIWNGGDVVAATSPADYSAQVPETGTIFRITTNKPGTSADVYTFNTERLKGKTLVYDPHKITVWPNPYFAYNPEESVYGGSRMVFSGLPESGTCIIRIFNLAGQVVRVIDHSNQGTQTQVWDLTNNYGIASGMYIAFIETARGSVIRKLAVIN
ncbi:MAG: T9SS type A sorting domain-containing protein [FCB group bacterium]|nr:T9SS type A sorting domain-containing protein [FCB group bacterium]